MCAQARTPPRQPVGHDWRLTGPATFCWAAGCLLWRDAPPPPPRPPCSPPPFPTPCPGLYRFYPWCPMCRPCGRSGCCDLCGRSTWCQASVPSLAASKGGCDCRRRWPSPTPPVPPCPLRALVVPWMRRTGAVGVRGDGDPLRTRPANCCVFVLKNFVTLERPSVQGPLPIPSLHVSPPPPQCGSPPPALSP